MKNYKNNNQGSQEIKVVKTVCRKTIGWNFDLTGCLKQWRQKPHQTVCNEWEREREKITQSIILVHSLELHPVPRKPLGISLSNQQQITITQHHIPFLPLHTHNQNNPLTCRFTVFQEYKLKTITRIKGTYYIWCTGNHRAPNSLLESMAQP